MLLWKTTLVLLLPFAIVAISPGSLVAQELAPHTPRVCTGFFGSAHQEQELDLWGLRQSICPESHAIFATLRPSSPRDASAEQVRVYSYCCPLPAEDIVTDERVIVRSECPKEYIGIGTASIDCTDCNNALICARINTERYLLLDQSEGAMWGPASVPWKHRRRITTAEIPPGIKYGVARRSKFFLGTSGCIGFPFGSILSAKYSKRCSDLGFRQLAYRGVSGDPAAGTPVQMYKECIVLRDIYSARPACERLKE